MPTTYASVNENFARCNVCAALVNITRQLDARAAHLADHARKGSK